jgi:Nickel responsive protein SCO4226-like
MPLYMDTHRIGRGVKAKDVAEAHAKDLEVQGDHGVRYIRYWVDESEGVVSCLAEAPDADAAAAVHRQAHGLLADEIREVVEGT